MTARSPVERALKIANEIRSKIDSKNNTIVLGDGSSRIQLKLMLLDDLAELEEVLSEIPNE